MLREPFAREPSRPGKHVGFPSVKGPKLVEYDVSVLDRSPAISLKILAAGARLPVQQLARYQVEPLDDGDSTALIQAIEKSRPDILLLDAALVSAELAALLAHPLHSGMPVVLQTGEADADLAGLLLDCPLHLLEAGADGFAVLQAVNRAAEALQHQAADASGRFDEGDRFAALKRDAERVAAALAELVASRPAAAQRPVDAARIRAHIKARRLRDRFFSSELLADPGWDMMLDLAAARLEERPVSVSSLCIAANVPTTTALRWIKNLCDAGIFQRAADPGDARRAFIGLSPRSAEAMEACLDAVLNQPGQ